ncbi:DNA phosphorothioation-dependent restriction protein DptG [Planomicrobium koreense]|uniref:DNA phosphorothioation-dependent restriction protein DptG n=1 Tax=Planococcus koreensis TaxID=112331 RepID=A0A7W8CSV8_9BACL|nr:DNA phosphorothioation-dependent restriction protein DptG [Planococcus koreensis]MBB5180254.1 DNA phosphorothioation-dependent restriction protein DptG [Planococcus koreensis]
MGIIDLEDLKERIFTKKNHDIGRVVDVLPFQSTKRTTNLNTEFHKISGDYVRHITEIRVDEMAISSDIRENKSNINILSEYIASEIDFEDDEARHDFGKFIDEYLFNQKRLNTIHPYLFNFVATEEKISTEAGKYARFLQDVLLQKDQEIKNFFINKETDDILTELIITNLDILMQKKTDYSFPKERYQPFLPSISQLYKEDLRFLSKHKEYFIQTFPQLTHYYTFLYACQLLWNFEQFEDGDMDRIQPFYYAFEWESITKRRKVADPLRGYKFIQGRAKNLFPHIHTLSQLSHNKWNDNYFEEEPLPVMSYHKLYKKATEKGEDYSLELLNDMNDLIAEYTKWRGIRTPEKAGTLEKAFKAYFECVKEGTSSEVASKYGKSIEDLAASVFLKSRGGIGYVLNLKHDFTLLLVAVSVKEERIPLNQLYKELEKRGIALDYYSRQELVKLLDSHNILDKKSDSGDSQYVKPIL